MSTTPGDEAVQAALERLTALVPVHDRARDAATGGTVSALLRAVAAELALLEQDLARLADAAFIETCEEWLVPYLADLVGLREVPPDLGTAVSRRALVANTVAYRRRKGTVAVLEQVAGDVSGWRARAVEHHALLATTSHTRFPRLDRAALPSVRPAARLELAALVSPPGPRGAIDPLPHLAEVRRIAPRRGRWNVRNVGVFLFEMQAYDVGSPRVEPVAVGTRGGWSQARPAADPAADGYWFDPLGRPTPLVVPGRREDRIEQATGEAELPVPLRPRRLLQMLSAARQVGAAPEDLPVGVRLGATGADLPPDRIRVCRLEDLAPGDEPQVMVDAVEGRLFAYEAGVRTAPGLVCVRYAYGGVADVGAGTYDRTVVHEQALDADLYTPGRPAVAVAGAEPPPAVRQLHVVRDPADPAAPDGSLPSIAAALAAAEASWADPAAGTTGDTLVVSVGDCATYEPAPTAGDLEVHVPEATRLVLVAASWPTRRRPDGEVLAPVPGRYVPTGLRPHVLGSLRITGAAGSSVVVDGLVVEGDLEVGPGALGSLTVVQSTVTGTVRVGEDNGAASLRVLRSVVGGVTAEETLPFLAVSESVVDARGAGPAVHTPGAQVCVSGSTVRGTVHTRTLDASSSILDGLVTVVHRQVGCLRFSHVGAGSSTPRQFRCVGAAPGDPVPTYTSTEPASPAYLALDGSCHPAIATGGEGESEMGVHHHLQRPLRRRSSLRQIEPYVPAGIEIGIFGS